MWRVLTRSVVAVAAAATLALSAVPGSSAATGSALSASHKPPGSPKAFKFAFKVHGQPVHWNKCQTIDYRLSSAKAPAHALRQVKHAIKLLHRGSGLRFNYLGRSKLIPGNTTNYPGRTRLLIGWSTPRKSKALAGSGGSEAGIGGFRFMGNGEIIQGSVVLNRKVTLTNGFGNGPRVGEQGTVGELLLHELGHAVGLAHVKSQSQIMFPELTRKTARYGAGDLNGLAKVGKDRHCFS
jgi:Matrixin